jgi:hypothetical protein
VHRLVTGSAALMMPTQVDFADCEAHDGGLFAQDINAWTSLALVGVGLVTVGFIVRRRLSAAFLGLAAAIAAGGVGSVLYHGDPSDTAQLVHDGSLIASAGFVAGWHVGRLTPGRAGAAALIGLATGLAAGVVGASTSAVVTNAFVAVAVVVIVIAESAARRRGLTPVLDGVVLGLAGVGVLAWLLGRPDSPLCYPASWAQPHALWHVLSALIVLAWVDRSSRASSRDAVCTTAPVPSL